MADALTSNIILNGYRNFVVQFTDVSDGTGLAGQVVYDATSGFAATTQVSAGINQAGQIFYPGVHTTILKVDYDVQDMKVQLQWLGTVSNINALVFGNAPEDFDWTAIGGLTCPYKSAAGIAAGLTGSIGVTTINAAPQATFSMVLYLRKNVPQS